MTDPIRVPFASPLMLPDGKYSLAEGELELNADAEVCEHCGTDLRAVVRGITLTDGESRPLAVNKWKAAGVGILKWLLRERV